MAYIKTNWVDGETIATAERMNHIENGIANSLTSDNIKTEQTNSDNDTYSCNYINNKVGYNISTTPTKVGYKINNKDVYVKKIDFGALPDTSSKSVATGIDFNSYALYKIEGICKYATNNIAFPLPFAHPSTIGYSIMVNIDNSNNIVVTTGSDRSGYNGTFYIYYY